MRFTLVDARTGVKMPAWVVRKHGYAFGLREWYKSHQLIPGSLVVLRKGQKPGEVIVEAKTQRASKDWIRTLIVGADGGLVFAMLKQPITAEFNDRMAIYVGDFDALDPLWEKQRSFEDQVVGVMRELTKVNPQGHVHAQELYAAINLVRRVPPAPLFSLLATQPALCARGGPALQTGRGRMSLLKPRPIRRSTSTSSGGRRTTGTGTSSCAPCCAPSTRRAWPRCRRTPASTGSIPGPAEVKQVDGIQHALMNHCALQPEFVNAKTTVVEAVFRLMLVNGNQPMSVAEMAKKLGKSADTILRTIGGTHVYRGIKPVRVDGS